MVVHTQEEGDMYVLTLDGELIALVLAVSYSIDNLKQLVTDAGEWGEDEDDVFAQQQPSGDWYTIKKVPVI